MKLLLSSFPDLFKIAKVTPLFKKGVQTSLNIYWILSKFRFYVDSDILVKLLP